MTNHDSSREDCDPSHDDPPCLRVCNLTGTGSKCMELHFEASLVPLDPGLTFFFLSLLCCSISQHPLNCPRVRVCVSVNVEPLIAC
jgi:hypothetical protein